MLLESIQAYNSPTAGTGLLASEFIPEGTVIWRLPPDAIKLTARELRRLPKEKQMLAYQCGDGYVLSEDDGEYMNHSCDPNTWWLDDETMTASRDIQPGEEITFDYASVQAGWWRSQWECRCQSEHCRGYLTGLDCLEPAFLERHRGHLTSWVAKYIQQQSGWRGKWTSWFAGLVGLTRNRKSRSQVSVGDT